MNQIQPTPKAPVRAELERIEEDCIHSGKAHFNAADRWGHYHLWLGLPAVVLSGLASVAFINESPILAAIMSGSVAILTAIQTFVKPSERAVTHKAAGDQYLALRNDARVFRQIKLDHVCDDQAAIDGLDALSTRRNELNAASPQVSRGDFEKARKGIDEGEAQHVVDKAQA